jgi:hypothetical protein
LERREARLPFRIVLDTRECANAAHAIGLLRTHGERPHHSRAAY